MQHGVITAGEPWGLGLDQQIMPQYLNDMGYQSHIVGKVGLLYVVMLHCRYATWRYYGRRTMGAGIGREIAAAISGSVWISIAHHWKGVCLLFSCS